MVAILSRENKFTQWIYYKQRVSNNTTKSSNVFPEMCLGNYGLFYYGSWFKIS